MDLLTPLVTCSNKDFFYGSFASFLPFQFSKISYYPGPGGSFYRDLLFFKSLNLSVLPQY